jgi:NAD(P)-dependent dehydrogenase (short-subunit alcohol dehydrogenase family)
MERLQAPIGSGFGAASTATQVLNGIDLSGTTAIVTGGHAGIGLATSLALAAAGASVIVPARNPERARKALGGKRGVTVEAMDLLDPVSVETFADRFLARGQALHRLINNAGIMVGPLARDARGYEIQFATNHLGHFQLTAQLWPALRQAGGARVVGLSSAGHRNAPMDFDDLNFERRDYDEWTAYGQSKTANALFALELDERGQANGVRAFSVHPGRILTGLSRRLSRASLQEAGMMNGAGQPILDPSQNAKSPEQGAATALWAATSPQLNGLGGLYCENCDVAAGVEAPPALPGDVSMAQGVRPWAIDRVAAARLWTVSEALIGVRFAI